MVVIDIITIDHHISETKFPNIYSLINPNRYDENSEFKNLAAVGVTFVFLMAFWSIIFLASVIPYMIFVWAKEGKLKNDQIPS